MFLLFPISDISKTIHRHKGSSSDLDSIDESDTESQTSGSKRHRKNMVIPPLRRPSLLVQPGRHHYGSFYLRMGAVGKLKLIFLPHKHNE